jgi:putative RecB family exonuclease
MSSTLIKPKVVAPLSRGPEYLSPSAAKQYLSCSLQYYFARILRIPKATTPNLHLGKAVHAGLQEYHWTTMLEGEALPEHALSVYREVFDNPPDGNPVSFQGDQERAESRVCGERVLTAYLEADVSKLEGQPLGVEVQLQEEFRDLELPLLGVIDLVKAGYVPVDFKTVGATPNLDQEAWQHQIQLIAYQVLIEAATAETVPHLELVFLVKTKTPKVIRHAIPAAGPQQKERFWQILRAIVEGIREERFYPQPGMHCNWCQFRQECAAWKGGGR